MTPALAPRGRCSRPDLGRSALGWSAAVVAMSFVRVALAQPAPADEPPPSEPTPPKLETFPQPPPQAPAAQTQPAQPPPKPAAAAPKPAAAAPAPAAVAETKPKLDISGYVAPGFGFRVRPAALPRDRFEVGFVGGASLAFEANPFRYWKATVNLVLDSKTIAAVTGVEQFDLNGDGTSDGLTVKKDKFDIGETMIEEATATFQPHKAVDVRGGIVRIPFTLEQQNPNATLMFPNRAQPNDVFLTGPDIGALVEGHFYRGRLEASAGVFGGDSLGLTLKSTVPRGVVTSLRVDVNPFGAFPFTESDAKRGPFRLGAGFGLIYRPVTLYDEESGYEVATAQDVRLCASLRMAVAGVYVGVEYLRRQQTDSATSRPQTADGAYVQGSYFIRLTASFGLAPVGRLGIVVEDESAEPRTTGWTDAGLAFYPAADAAEPDGVSVTVQYVGERRFTEGETAQGAQTELRVRF